MGEGVVAQALRNAAAELASTSDTARLDAELLMAEALGVSRSEMLLRRMDAAVPPAFAEFVARRVRHEPIAYILGRQEFRGLDFAVGPQVLIPRTDSEVLVEAALEVHSRPGRVLDCGTGSGALLLSVLAERPAAEGVGIDASPGALAVAAANAASLGLADRARMVLRDWTQSGWADDLGQFDLILANPPYVETDADLAPSVRAHEPAVALFAGPDGLDDYRRLIPQLPDLLTVRGIALVEIGSRQEEAVREIARQAGFCAELRRDLAGRSRVLILQLGLGKGGNRH